MNMNTNNDEHKLSAFKPFPLSTVKRLELKKIREYYYDNAFGFVLCDGIEHFTSCYDISNNFEPLPRKHVEICNCAKEEVKL